MNRLSFFAVSPVVFALLAAVDAKAADGLANAGFETDAALNQGLLPVVTGWSTFGGANTASASLAPVRTGIGSLALVGPGGFNVPGAFQALPASPGQLWDFQGYLRTEAALPTGSMLGLIKMVFSDGVMDLEPASVTIGQADIQAFPGIIATPQLNSASTPGVWQFTHAQGVAPPNTTEVRFFALFVNENPGTVYVDDLQAMVVPEPATALLLAAGLAVVVWRAKMRHV